jgi:hypothetical protein
MRSRVTMTVIAPDDEYTAAGWPTSSREMIGIIGREHRHMRA